jgi:hypothetical protein
LRACYRAPEERCGAEDPGDEEVDCGELRGGTSAAGVLAEPPNDEAPGVVDDGVLAEPPNDEAPGVVEDGVVAAPPNEEAPGPGGVLSVDCGTNGACVEPGEGGTSAGGVFAEPPNEEAPGAGCGAPVEGETGVTAPGATWLEDPGGTELPTDAEPSAPPPRRRAVAPSWVTQ